MTTDQKRSRKQIGLRALALVLLCTGGVLTYMGSHNSAIRSVGVTAVMAGVCLDQLSKTRNRPELPEASGEVNNPNVPEAPGRLLWIVSLSLVPAMAGAWYLLNFYAANGGQVIWPVNLFAGVGLVCAVVWGLLVARIVWAQGRLK